MVAMRGRPAAAARPERSDARDLPIFRFEQPDFRAALYRVQHVGAQKPLGDEFAISVCAE